MPGKISLEKQLADELKADIAERYFGFRKLIEEDSLDLAEKTRQYSIILQKRISFDLIRIYVLLHEPKIIHEFLNLITLNDELFYDPYLVESKNILTRVLEQQHFHGFTKFRRYKNFVFDCYEKLYFHAGHYSKKFRELQNEQGILIEEIRQFYRQNDISAIMHFLHRLGDAGEGAGIHGGIEIGMAEGLAQKLRIEPPHPIEQTLPFIPPLPPPSEITGALKKLISQAWDILPDDMIAIFAHRQKPEERRLIQEP